MAVEQEATEEAETLTVERRMAAVSGDPCSGDLSGWCMKLVFVPVEEIGANGNLIGELVSPTLFEAPFFPGSLRRRGEQIRLNYAHGRKYSASTAEICAFDTDLQTTASAVGECFVTHLRVRRKAGWGRAKGTFHRIVPQ